MTTAAEEGTAASGQGRSIARRNALLLAAAQAIVGSASPITISMGALAGSYLLGPDKTLATLPITGFSLGIAFGAVLAAAVMKRTGRRYGFMGGALLPAIGGIIAALALFQQSFALLVAGLTVVGFGNSFVQQYRFAAADAAPAAFKPQAISLVLAGGVFSAIIGPQVAIYTRQAFEPVMFAGCFVALVPLAFVGIGILSFLRISEDTAAVADHAKAEPARPLAEIVSQPRFIAALACAVGSYALMTFIMTGAPLAMVGCGFSPDLATLGIQWHAMAMFAPSFFTGRLIARFGQERIVATGLFILIGCAVVAHLGIELWNFWLALILLGLGWNFGFIGATAMVTGCYRPSEKNKVQGFHDVVLFGTVAFASLASGQVLNAYGWDALNLVIWPVVLICLALLAVNRLREGTASAG
ncbi:MAG TPA: MFS transporter [Pararhizobium sp.]|nr:MFS transporter [Pararhizobium sp.]